MQSLKIFITLCFIAALSNPVNAQQLWSGTVYGMSESTIKTIFPKVIEVKSNNPDISSVYELNEGQHHDHLVCLDCGKVEEFYDAEIEKRQQMVAKTRGFILQEHAPSLYANCSKTDCQPRDKSKG